MGISCTVTFQAGFSSAFERNEASTAQVHKGSLEKHASILCFNRSLMSSGLNSTFQTRLWAPGSLWNLSSLWVLALSNNRLCGSIGPLTNLQSLRWLLADPMAWGVFGAASNWTFIYVRHENVVHRFRSVLAHVLQDYI